MKPVDPVGRAMGVPAFALGPGTTHADYSKSGRIRSISQPPSPSASEWMRVGTDPHNLKAAGLRSVKVGSAIYDVDDLVTYHDEHGTLEGYPDGPPQDDEDEGGDGSG